MYKRQVFSILSPRIMGQATTSLFASITARLGGDASAAVDFGFIGYILGVMIAQMCIRDRCRPGAHCAR